MTTFLNKNLLLLLVTSISYTAQAQYFDELYRKDSSVNSDDGKTEVYFVGAADLQITISEKKIYKQILDLVPRSGEF
jgi:hypothetical protein